MKNLFLLSLMLVASPAFAQMNVDTTGFKPGQTIVSLNATERVKIKQDLLQGSLRIEVEGTDAKKLQNEINQAMQKAVAEGKKATSVKVSTGQYYVYSYEREPPVKPLNTKIKPKPEELWKASQTLDLEGKDQAALLDLAGKIQDMGFVMNGLNYTLSPEEAEIYKDNLMVKALEKLQRKASLAAKALGKTGYEILEVNIDNVPVQPMPVMYEARMKVSGAAMDMAEPVAQAGEQTVDLNVNARALLKP